MELTDAKIAVAEARTDTKFAELRADLGKFATKGTVWGAVGTLGGLLLAAAAFAGDRFDAGLGLQGVIAPIIEQQKQRDSAQDRKLDEINRRNVVQDRKLDEILRRLPPTQ